MLEVGFNRIDPAVQLAIAHGVRQRHVEIIFRGDRRELALHVEKVIREGSFKGFYTQASAIVLDR